MADWARVFNVDQSGQNKQVLIVRRFNVDTECDDVTVTFLHSTMIAFCDITISFDEEEPAQKFFERVATEENAQKIVETNGDILSLLRSGDEN